MYLFGFSITHRLQVVWSRSSNEDLMNATRGFGPLLTFTSYGAMNVHNCYILESPSNMVPIVRRINLPLVSSSTAPRFSLNPYFSLTSHASKQVHKQKCCKWSSAHDVMPLGP